MFSCQHVGLPYMAHESHAPDTTFIIAEPDFVFYREDGEAHLKYMSSLDAVACQYSHYDEMAELLPARAQKSFRAELQQYLKDLKNDKNAPWPLEPPEPIDPNCPEQEKMRWTAEAADLGYGLTYCFSRKNKPPPEGFKPEDISDHLHDLQAYMTAASRLGRGGFLWCGWNVVQWKSGDTKSKGVRKTCPLTGAQLSMMTSKCARELLPVWLQEKDTHMGTFFSQKMGLQWQEWLGCAYVYPPIGGYFTHKSTTCSTEKTERVLQSHFEDKWCQAGTRKENEDQVHRWICGFTAKGPAQWLHQNEIRLPEELPGLRWYTQAPKGTRNDQMGWRYYHEGISPANKPANEA